MESTLQWLPNELLDPILDDLDLHNIARLTQCNKRLRGRLEAELWKNTGRVNRAIEWGCKTGNLECLRGAVRHGGRFDVFALSFAARKGQDEAFKFMLDHDARIEVEPTDDRTLRHQVWKLTKSLSRPANFGMMRQFYEAGLDKLARDAGVCPQAVWPLERVIANGGPDVLERLQLVLGQGGIRLDISWPNSGSLISMAIDANSSDTVDFLVAQGVDIHGKEESRPKSFFGSRAWPCHVPVFAAAHAMARSDHGVARMQQVLQHGADINHCAKVITWSRPSYMLIRDYYWTTPLLVFLDSVSSWKNGPGPDLVEGLKFFINHGALFQLPDVEEPGNLLPRFKDTRRPKGRPLPTDLLLARWGLQALNKPRFLTVIKFLANHGLQGAGLSPEEVANMIIQHTKTPVFSVESRAAVKGRGLLLDALLDGRTASENNKVLDWLLIKTGQTIDLLRVDYGQALDSLVAAGATVDPVRVASGSGRSSDVVRLLAIRGRPADDIISCSVSK